MNFDISKQCMADSRRSTSNDLQESYTKKRLEMVQKRMEELNKIRRQKLVLFLYYYINKELLFHDSIRHSQIKKNIIWSSFIKLINGNKFDNAHACVRTHRPKCGRLSNHKKCIFSQATFYLCIVYFGWLNRELF